MIIYNIPNLFRGHELQEKIGGKMNRSIEQEISKLRLIKFLEAKLLLNNAVLYLSCREQRLSLRQESMGDILLKKPQNPGSVVNRLLSVALFIPELLTDCEEIVVRYLSEKEQKYYYKKLQTKNN